MNNLLKRNKCVEENMGLVYMVAKKFSGRGVDFEDLIQIGSIGLIKASERFKPEFNVKFSTYAVTIILGEIKRFFRDDGIVKIPRKIKETGLKINKSVCELRKVLNREPSISELSEYMDIEVEKIIEALDAARPCESILAENQNSVSLLESVADSQESNIETEDKIFLKEILEFLDVRLRQIIFLRFFKDKTQNEVANVMKISQVQVSRLEKKALGILKNKFNFY